MTDHPSLSKPLTYREAYDAARTAVENYPLIAIRMQLDRMAGSAQTEAQWGAVDALSDLLSGQK
jgi:hypothetical protein